MAVGCAVLAFGKKVWGELEPQWAKRAAGWLDGIVTNCFAHYSRVYAKHVYYKHRTFDVKGFSTPGKFALELEHVYVALAVDAAVTSEISQDPIRLPKDYGKTVRRDVFAWLDADPGRAHNFAVVGPPGSGKTTLLKHLALVFAAGKSSVKLTPILLFLRDLAATIASNASVRLSDLVEATLQEQPPPADWFARRLERGECLVMLDGLDEVPDPETRRKVVRWVERQVEALGGNSFLLTSRPNGYSGCPFLLSESCL